MLSMYTDLPIWYSEDVLEGTRCIHCDKVYEPERLVTAVTTARGRLLWWHFRAFCVSYKYVSKTRTKAHS